MALEQNDPRLLRAKLLQEQWLDKRQDYLKMLSMKHQHVQTVATIQAQSMGSPESAGGDDSSVHGSAWAFRTDGTDDYITIPLGNPGWTEYTFSCWAKWGVDAGANQAKPPLTKGTANGGAPYGTGLYLDDTDSKITFFYSNASDQFRAVTSSTTYVTRGIWYHVVGSAKNGGKAYLLVNGEILNQETVNGGAFTNHDSPILIGSLGGGAGGVERWMDGAVDDVRIYDRQLSLADVNAIYNNGNGEFGDKGRVRNSSTGVTAANNLVMWYKGEEGFGTETAEAISSLPLGTFVNGTTWTSNTAPTTAPGTVQPI